MVFPAVFPLADHDKSFHLFISILAGKGNQKAVLQIISIKLSS